MNEMMKVSLTKLGYGAVTSCQAPAAALFHSIPFDGRGLRSGKGSDQIGQGPAGSRKEHRSRIVRPCVLDWMMQCIWS